MSAHPIITAMDAGDDGNVPCWCCDSVGAPARMVQLGNHPEVHLCPQCAHYVHQQAWVIEDEGKRGPTGVHAGQTAQPAGWSDMPRLAPQQSHRREAALARQAPPIAMQIELLVVSDCANEAAAAELIATAVAETGVNATVIRTVIASEQEARQRRFIGSPTILLNGLDPFASVEAPVALACRLYSTPDGLRGVPGLRDLRQALTRAAAD